MIEYSSTNYYYLLYIYYLFLGKTDLGCLIRDSCDLKLKIKEIENEEIEDIVKQIKDDKVEYLRKCLKKIDKYFLNAIYLYIKKNGNFKDVLNIEELIIELINPIKNEDFIYRLYVFLLLNTNECFDLLFKDFLTQINNNLFFLLFVNENIFLFVKLFRAFLPNDITIKRYYFKKFNLKDVSYELYEKKLFLYKYINIYLIDYSKNPEYYFLDNEDVELLNDKLEVVNIFLKNINNVNNDLYQKLYNFLKDNRNSINILLYDLIRLINSYIMLPEEEGINKKVLDNIYQILSDICNNVFYKYRIDYPNLIINDISNKSEFNDIALLVIQLLKNLYKLNKITNEKLFEYYMLFYY